MLVVDWPTALSDPTTLRARGLLLAEGRLVLERILAGAAGGAAAIVAVLSTPAAALALDLEARVGDRLTTRSPAEIIRPAPRPLADSPAVPCSRPSR